MTELPRDPEEQDEELVEEAVVGEHPVPEGTEFGPEPGVTKDPDHGVEGDEEDLPDGDADDEEGTEL
jgi:hypothetical protein